jgi:hypothetical protein
MSYINLKSHQLNPKSTRCCCCWSNPKSTRCCWSRRCEVHPGKQSQATLDREKQSTSLCPSCTPSSCPLSLPSPIPKEGRKAGNPRAEPAPSPLPRERSKQQQLRRSTNQTLAAPPGLSTPLQSPKP